MSWLMRILVALGLVLAIIIAIFRHYEGVDVDRFNILRW